MNIGRAIRLCRTQRGITQEQLAQQAGCSLACVNQLENNKRDPTVTVNNLANALGIPAALLFFLGSDEEDLRGIAKSLQGELARTILILLDEKNQREREISGIEEKQECGATLS